MGTTRTIITLSEKEKSWLKAFSRTQGISLAEGVRRGIGCLKASEGRKTYQKIVQETQGIWQKEDGLIYQERMRSEWEAR